MTGKNWETLVSTSRNLALHKLLFKHTYLAVGDNETQVRFRGFRGFLNPRMAWEEYSEGPVDILYRQYQHFSQHDNAISSFCNSVSLPA